MLEILDKSLAAGAIRYIGGLAKAPMVEADAAVLRCEHWYLLPPAHMVATRPVGEDDSRAIAILFVV